MAVISWIVVLMIVQTSSQQGTYSYRRPLEANPSPVCVGDSVTIRCEIDFTDENGITFPTTASFRRFANNTPITSTTVNHQLLRNGPNGVGVMVSNITSDDNNTIYTCTNDAAPGNFATSIMLEVTGNPPSSGDITIIEGCLSIITLWDPFTSDPVCGPVSYDVTISPSDGVVMMRIADTSYNFTGLIPYTSYTVTVTGRNDAGVGEPASVIVNAPTIANLLPHVNNLRNTRTTNDTITVRWDDAAGICSGLVTYFVTISTVNETVLASVAIKNYLQFTFTDLLNNTSYSITVLGANEFGNGTIEIIHVTTGAVPQDSAGAGEPSDDDDLSTGVAVAITLVVTFIITLVVTAAMTYIITRMYYKRQPEKIVRKNNNENSGTQENSQFVLKGRDVKMDTNPSYAIMDKDTIKMDTNPAYAVTK